MYNWDYGIICQKKKLFHCLSSCMSVYIFAWKQLTRETFKHRVFCAARLLFFCCLVPFNVYLNCSHFKQKAPILPVERSEGVAKEYTIHMKNHGNCNSTQKIMLRNTALIWRGTTSLTSQWFGLIYSSYNKKCVWLHYYRQENIYVLPKTCHKSDIMVLLRCIFKSVHS